MEINNKFPFITNNSEVTYLDSAATSLKLKSVIDKQSIFLSNNGTNPHVKDYGLGFDAFAKISHVREKLANFINAKSSDEIIFTSGTTHSINLLANGLQSLLLQDDEIILTELEHSANMLPWVALANKTGAKIKIIPLDENFSIDLKWIKTNISYKTKILTISHVTNTLGNINDIFSISKVAREINPSIIIHVDCAQSIAHLPVDVTRWDVDFISWSAHKMYGPFGLGCLWGKKSFLDNLTPLFFGGGMNQYIHENMQDYDLAKLPEKLEGGTPNISAIYAYEAAIDFINEIGLKNINTCESALKEYFVEQVNKFNLTTKIDFYNLSVNSPIILFNAKNINPQDVAIFLSQKYKIAVRGGASCARRIKGIINTEIAVRASFGIYNTKADVDKLIYALNDVENFLDVVI